MSEIVCIWNACAMVILWDLDGSGGKLSRRERLISALTSAVIQTCFEWMADLTSCVVLKIIFGIDVIARARGRKWYWALPTCGGFVACSALATGLMLFYVLDTA